MVFVDVKNDIAFRKIFGNEKKTVIIISFLNAVLQLEDDRKIESVSFVNPYQFPRIAGEKASIIDVLAKDQKGRQFIVEMQMTSAEGFDKRVQYYICKEYSTQIESGEEYVELKPTYFVGILDFTFFDSPEYLSNHIILNGKTYEHKLKDISFTFIELKKFHLKKEALKTLIEKWIFFIKNADELEVIPEHVDDEGLNAAYKNAATHNWTRDELRSYDKFLMAEQDEQGRLTFAVNEKVQDIVKRCLEENMSVELITKIVNLSLKEVEQIIHQIKKRQDS